MWVHPRADETELVQKDLGRRKKKAEVGFLSWIFIYLFRYLPLTLFLRVVETGVKNRATRVLVGWPSPPPLLVALLSLFLPRAPQLGKPMMEKVTVMEAASLSPVASDPYHGLDVHCRRPRPP